MKVKWPEKILRVLADTELQTEKPPELPQAIQEARHEWLCAQNYYNSVSDSDLVDHAVYLMQAAEKKYTYLLKKARLEGITFSQYR